MQEHEFTWYQTSPAQCQQVAHQLDSPSQVQFCTQAWQSRVQPCQVEPWHESALQGVWKAGLEVLNTRTGSYMHSSIDCVTSIYRQATRNDKHRHSSAHRLHSLWRWPHRECMPETCFVLPWASVACFLEFSELLKWKQNTWYLRFSLAIQQHHWVQVWWSGRITAGFKLLNSAKLFTGAIQGLTNFPKGLVPTASTQP